MRPTVAAVDEAGRAYVLDVERHGIEVFSRDGTPAGTWTISMLACCVWPIYPRDAGTVWMPIVDYDRETRESRYGVQAYGRPGAVGRTLWVPDIKFEPIQYTFTGLELSVPLGPRLRWGPTPSGGVFVGGTDRYRFEVHERDGSVLVIEKYWDPVPYPAEEIEWTRRLTVARLQGQLPGWSWDGAEIPRHKPAFSWVIPVRSGGYWVARHGASVRVPDCPEDPQAEGIVGEAPVRRCWDTEWILDAFDRDGRYLGEIDVPTVMGFAPLLLHVDGDLVVTGGADGQGIYRVKRYRLVRPE